MRILFFTCCALFLSLISAAQTNPCNPTGNPYTSLGGDTTIVLSSGTMLTFNRCEFFDKRDCIEITEITTPEDLARAGLNMYDQQGRILLTCGMVKIDFKKCGKDCLDVPVKVKFRINFQDCTGLAGRIPNLYFNYGTGWEQSRGAPPELITENNIKYMVFETKCSVAFNCDVPKGGQKLKFIASKGNKIKQLRVGIDCPLFYTNEKLVNPSRKVKIMTVCSNPERVMVQSLQFKSNGDSVLTPQVKLTELRHGPGRMNCGDRRRSVFNSLFGWIGAKRGDIHRKYFLPGSP